VSTRLIIVLGIVVLSAVLLGGCADESTDVDTAETDAAVQEEATQEETPVGEFTVVSSAFEHGGAIPPRFCNTGVTDGDNISIPLAWENTPEDTVSFALVTVDHHEIANEWIHWMVTGIPASTGSLAEGESGSLSTPILELLSTNGQSGYQGPEPPAGSGDHEYQTLIFALDAASVDLADGATFTEFLDAVEGSTLAEASISGFFGR